MNEKKETEQVSGETVPETPQLPPKKTKESFLPEGSAKEKFFYIVKTAILIAVSAFLLAFSSYCLIAPNDFAIGGVTGIAIILGKGHERQDSAEYFGILHQPSPSRACLFRGEKEIRAPHFRPRNFAVRFLYAFGAAARSHAGVSGKNLRSACRRHRNRHLDSARLQSGREYGRSGRHRRGGAEKIPRALHRLDDLHGQLRHHRLLLFRLSRARGRDAERSAPHHGRLRTIRRKQGKRFHHQRLPFRDRIQSHHRQTRRNGAHHHFQVRQGRHFHPRDGDVYARNALHAVCVINRRQIATFRKILKDVDPDSFAVMSNVSQVLGLGFFSGDN